MMIELDAIFASDLATNVFVYGSIALVAVLALAALWISRPASSREPWRASITAKPASS
jgi:hypothetical protein